MERAVERIRSGGHPDAAVWAHVYVLSPPDAAEAPAVFTDLVEPLEGPDP